MLRMLMYADVCRRMQVHKLHTLHGETSAKVKTSEEQLEQARMLTYADVC